MTFPDASLALARRVLEACESRRLHLATAESCTGGLIAACLTEIAGSSNVVDRGYVTYDNRAKEEMLGVPADALALVGAVSEEVARAMAEGALARAHADVAVAVTGIAGPGGATSAKPVGLVHIAVALRDGATLHERCVFGGDRRAIRLASLDAALGLVLRAVGGNQDDAAPRASSPSGSP